MNFLPARLTDGKVASVLGDLPLAGPTRQALRDAGAPEELILGIRPEHFEDARLVDESHLASGATYEGQVDVVESMGSDKYVYLPLDTERASTAELEELAADAGVADLPAAGAQLVTRLSAESRAAEGAPVRLWINAERVHLFDPADGRNLTLGAQSSGRAAPSSG
jgi:multiple sugar transport system ATP-binding protein